MDRNEQFVREHWASMGPMIVGRFDICDMNGEMNWQAAREFTEQRLEEIRQVEAEVDAAYSDVRWFAQGAQYEDKEQEAIHLRILAREQAALAALKRGLKETR
jgi:hypothetical protein